MMKHIKTNITAWLISVFIGAGLFFSCVDEINVGDAFLEKQPGVDLTIDTIFAKGENAKSLLWALYWHIGSPLKASNQMYQAPAEVLSDTYHSYNDWAGPNTTYYPGLIDESSQVSGHDKFVFTTSGDRVSIWDAIRVGWILIENLDRVPDLSKDEISQLKGETYIILASRFFDGYRNFGGLPLVERTYASGEPFERGRATVEETYQFIDSLIVCALNEKLPWTVQDPINWAGRLTKASAMALRAKVALFEASPLFNDNTIYEPYTTQKENQNDLHVWLGGYDASRWNTALTYFEDFFRENAANGNYYALLQPAGNTEADYCKVYRQAYWNRGGTEKVMEIITDSWVDVAAQNYGWPDNRTSLIAQSHQGTINPTVDFMEMFPMANGKNFSYQNLYGTKNPDNIDIFVGRDPRLYETMLVPREKMQEDYAGKMDIQLWEGGDPADGSGKLNADGVTANRFMSGLLVYKWCLDFRNHTLDAPFSYAYIRMADMHLMYAEALAQTGSLQKACDEVNKVRARVGLGKIETMNPELNLTSNKDNLIKEILRERAVELNLEDSRLYDLIRYKLVNKFTTPLREIKIYRKDANGDKMTGGDTRLTEGEAWPSFIYDVSDITFSSRRWWEPGYWTNRFFLSPLPRNEINKGYGLTQNPGW